MQREESQIIVIFGSTGDLTKRKLIPALYRLYQRGKLNDSSPIVCLGRRELDQHQFIDHLQPEAFIDDLEDSLFTRFASNIRYCPFDLSVNSAQDLQTILTEVRKEWQCRENLLFYLALPTTLFSSVAALLKPVVSPDGWTRVVFEKPFGEDLGSATRLNEEIGAVLDEDQIFRVDH